MNTKTFAIGNFRGIVSVNESTGKWHWVCCNQENSILGGGSSDSEQSAKLEIALWILWQQLASEKSWCVVNEEGFTLLQNSDKEQRLDIRIAIVEPLLLLEQKLFLIKHESHLSALN